MVLGILELVDLAIAGLTDTEIEILAAVARNGTKTASSISEKCGVPRSTFWFNLRKLDQKGLVEFGNGPVVLTPLGEILTRGSSIVERSAVEALLSETQCPKALAEKGQRDREVAGASLARGTFRGETDE